MNGRYGPGKVLQGLFRKVNREIKIESVKAKEPPATDSIFFKPCSAKKLEKKFIKI